MLFSDRFKNTHDFILATDSSYWTMQEKLGSCFSAELQQTNLMPITEAGNLVENAHCDDLIDDDDENQEGLMPGIASIGEPCDPDEFDIETLEDEVRGNLRVHEQAVNRTLQVQNELVQEKEASNTLEFTWTDESYDKPNGEFKPRRKVGLHVYKED